MESISRQYACAYCSFLCVSDEALIEHVDMIHGEAENHNLEQENFVDKNEVDVNDDVSNFDENDEYSAVDFVACEIKEEPPDQNGIEMDDIEAESTMDYSNYSEEDLDSQTIHDEDSQESQEKSQSRFSEKELKERSHEKLVERREDNVQIGREKRAKEKADKGCKYI